ncbi:MAG: ABC transporter substrate-binding protein [bacterium]
MRNLPKVILLFGTLFTLGGCGDTTSPTIPDPAAAPLAPPNPTFQGVKLKVSALEDPALAEVAADLVGEWQASRQGEVEIVAKPAAVAAGGLDPAVDVWLIRGQKLGELIDTEAIEPLGDLNADWAKRPPVFESIISRYGPDRYGVPLGTRMLVLAYRYDVVNAPAMQETIKKAGLSFPPKTWDEFDKLITLLKQTLPGVLALPSSSEPGDHLLVDIFLARATAVGKHRDHFSFLFSAETMEPRIAGTPFADTLSALASLKPAGNLSPTQARNAFREGQAAFLIDYAENASLWARPDENSKIGVLPLPGSFRVYEPDRKAYDKMQAIQPSAYLPAGGGYLAVLARGRTPEIQAAAKDLLVYFSSDSTATSWAADRRMAMCPTRDAMLAAGFVDPRIAPKVESGAWGESILAQITGENPVVGLRIPGSSSFLADLEAAVAAGMTGKAPATELENAAKKWKERVSAFGVQRLKWHYRRSLVRPVTDPKAPPRGQ